jgi:hypothetical protein
MTHTALKRMVTEFLEWSKWFVVPNVEGRSKSGEHSYPGITDLVATKNSITVWIEVKVNGDRLSADQEKFRDDILAHRGHWIEVRDGLDGLAAYIEVLRKSGCII